MDRQIVGFLGQVKLLLWKNSILFKRNISGTIAEVLIALITWMLLILIRYFTESRKYVDTDFGEFPVAMTIPLKNNRDLIYYSPKNDYIKNIVENGVKLLKAIRPANNFTALPLPYDNINTFLSQSPYLVSRFLAYVEFPIYYNNYSSLPDNILYTLYTQEMPSAQYNIEKNLRPVSDYKYTDSPESLCGGNFNLFLCKKTLNFK